MAYRHNNIDIPRGPKQWSSPVRGSRFGPATMAFGGVNDSAQSRSGLDYGRPSWMQVGGQVAAGQVPARQVPFDPLSLNVPPGTRRITPLTKETRAALGYKSSRHACCVRCWKRASEEHRRNWLNCTAKCPACDDEHQHPGQACPFLGPETNDEWWMAHCGITKDKIPFGHLPVGLFSSSSGEVPAKPFPLNFRPENRTKVQDPWQGRLRVRSRSRSPSRSPPRRGNPAKGRFYRDRQRAINEAAALQGSRPPPPQVDQIKAETKSTQPLLDARDDGSSRGSSITSLEPRPTGIVWSDGRVTSPSVRELVAHDPWMGMLIHQTVKIADFFQRHPDQSKGEDLVSAGMAQYLNEIRAEQPTYLSAGEERSTGGDGLGQGN